MKTVLALAMLALAVSPAATAEPGETDPPLAAGERVLAGVDVLSTPPHALKDLLGKPTSTSGSECVPGQEAFSSFFSTWEVGGETISIAGVCGADSPDHGQILFVRLKGEGSGASGLATGKGLRLGQHRDDVARIYGSDFRETPRKDGPGSLIEIRSPRDCPTLTILLSSGKRVKEIELLGCG